MVGWSLGRYLHFICICICNCFLHLYLYLKTSLKTLCSAVVVWSVVSGEVFAIINTIATKSCNKMNIIFLPHFDFVEFRGYMYMYIYVLHVLLAFKSWMKYNGTRDS